MSETMTPKRSAEINKNSLSQTHTADTHTLSEVHAEHTHTLIQPSEK